MKLRIISVPDSTFGRRYYLQKKWLWFWLPIEITDIGFASEQEAKQHAEELAKGSWVTDSATF